MRVTAALRTWAEQHSNQLSESTLHEVHAIANDLSDHGFDDLDIAAFSDDHGSSLADLVGTNRGERAVLLIGVARRWVQAQSPATATTTPETATPSEHAQQATHEASTQSATAQTSQKKSNPERPGTTDSQHEALSTPLAASEIPGVLPTAAQSQSATQSKSQEQASAATSTAGTSQLSSTATNTGDVIGEGVDELFPTTAGTSNLEGSSKQKSDLSDRERLLGPDTRPRTWPWVLLAIASAALIVFGVYWFALRSPADTSNQIASGENAQQDPTQDTAQSSENQPSGESSSSKADQQSANAAQDRSSDGTQRSTENAQEGTDAAPQPEPTPAGPRYWAPVETVLNAGSSTITASTYNVNSANKAVLNGHTAALTGIVATNDGRVFTSGNDLRIVDWGKEVTIDKPDAINTTSALSSLIVTQNNRLVAGTANGEILILDLDDDAGTARTQSIHNSAVSALTELTDGRIAVASVDGELAVFDLNTPEGRESIPHDSEISAVVGLDDTHLATATSSGEILIWDLDASPPGFVGLNPSSTPLTSLLKLQDGRLAAGDALGKITIIEPIADAVVEAVLEGHTGPVRALVQFEDGRLISGGDDTTIQVWDLPSASRIRVLEGHGDAILALTEYKRSSLLSASSDLTGRVWDLDGPDTEAVVSAHAMNISSVAKIVGEAYVSGGLDGRVVVSAAETTAIPQTLLIHGAPIVDVDMNDLGQVVSLDSSAVLRITSLGEAPETIAAATIAEHVSAMASRSPSGVVTGHFDGVVRLYDLDEPGENEDATAAETTTGLSDIGMYRAHDGAVNDVVALADGRFVSVGNDKTARVIDPIDGKVTTFDYHTAPVSAVIELSDGRVATAAGDGIYVWDPSAIDSGNIHFSGHRAKTLSLVQISENILLSSAADGRVRMWDLNSPDKEGETLLDVPGIINPYLLVTDSGTVVATAARGIITLEIPSS